MRNKLIVFFIVIVLIFSVSGYRALTDSSDGQKAELAVIMYHSFLKDFSKSGKYVITPTQFENDIIYLKSIGCSFVSVNDIKNFKNSGGSLPEKAVLITMDDGNYNNYSYIYPILKKYKVPALISPIAYWVEKYTETGEINPAYTIITEQNIAEMAQSGLVEFGNHTYNLHGDGKRMGACRINGESGENYQQMLADDLSKAHEVILRASGKPPCALVYPYGAISPDSFDVAKNMGYDILFSCTEGINRIEPENGMYILKRYNRPSGISSNDFFNTIYK